jgi:uncharacterized protein (UPF0333 family)
MMNLRPHHRIHIPNTLAIFAVVLLLISNAAGFVTSQEADASGQQATLSVKADNTENEGINTSASKKSRGLNLGLLLFRRG